MNELMRRLLALPPQASSVALGIDRLHYFVISCTMLGATFVFLLALGFLLRNHRRSEAAVTPRLLASVRGEAVMITSILGLFLVFWVIGYRQYVELEVPPANSMTVYVSAKQWMWEFATPDGRSEADVLTVPTEQPVKLVMTSRDVIHSFYVPAFRIKQDVVPGRYVTAWFEVKAPGTYDIFCAEYCGVNHSRMLARVVALSPADYAAYLEDLPRRDREGTITSASGAFAREGELVAVRRACVACHTSDGQPHIGPTWARLYGSKVRMTDGREVVADEAYLTKSMMDPLADVVDGYKPVMPTYQGVLTAPEAAALVEYIKSLTSPPFSPSVVLPNVSGNQVDGGTNAADAGRERP